MVARVVVVWGVMGAVPVVLVQGVAEEVVGGWGEVVPVERMGHLDQMEWGQEMDPVRVDQVGQMGYSFLHWEWLQIIQQSFYINWIRYGKVIFVHWIVI